MPCRETAPLYRLPHGTMREKAVIKNHHRRDKLRSFVKQRSHPWLHLCVGHSLASVCHEVYPPPRAGPHGAGRVPTTTTA